MDAATYWELRARNSDLLTKEAELESQLATMRHQIAREAGIYDLRAKMRAALDAAGLPVGPLRFNDEQLEITPVPVKGTDHA